MSKMFKYAVGLLLTGAISLTVLSASAQRRGTSGAVGGGGPVNIARGGGGGGFGYRSGFGYGSSFGYRGGYYPGFYGPGFGAWGYPNIGFRMGAMPLGFYPFYFGTSLYYYAGGAFYRPNDTGGYTVTDPPVGAAIPNLPKNAHSIVINGEQFYEYRGVYYTTKVNDKGETIYVVAGKDGVLNTSETSNVALPKVGDVVNKLPDGSRKVNLKGVSYYAAPDGVYYETVVKDGNTTYRVANVPSEADYQ
jgi:hypothetical protein